MLTREVLNRVFISVSGAPRLATHIAVLPWQESGCARRFHVPAICSRSMQQAGPHILSYWLKVLLTLIHRVSAAFSSAAWILLLILLCIISCSFLFYPASSSSAGTSSTLPRLLLMTLLPCCLLSS